MTIASSGKSNRRVLMDERSWRVLPPGRSARPMDSLDHASRMPNHGSKMGIDATTKWRSEGFTRRWPNAIAMSREAVQGIDELWKRAGLERK
jgi:4-hydroxy-3-polyprenylbenzoate decarboxylase